MGYRHHVRCFPPCTMSRLLSRGHNHTYHHVGGGGAACHRAKSGLGPCKNLSKATRVPAAKRLLVALQRALHEVGLVLGGKSFRIDPLVRLFYSYTNDMLT